MCVKPSRIRLGFHCCKELVFAVKAAGGVVADVLGALHLLRLDDAQWNALLLCEVDCICQVRCVADLVNLQ